MMQERRGQQAPPGTSMPTYGVQLGGEAGPSVPTAAEAKTMWLERGVRSLQATLQKMAGDKKMSAYWDQPIHRSPDMEPRSVDGVGEAKEESLRSVPSTIPSLVPPDARNASLEAGDWLAQLRPLVGVGRPDGGDEPGVPHMVVCGAT